ncbi:bifunctional ABC transporter type 1 [Babesia duncani]|uniref:Bifunctional ABC transporter type 1 n=1 Tax=Babesia duncani TaxID=323732 RepID=A0AAD9PI91_9APIC|nr:bifunctional ABC transporter type 1 [Babesia duncani]
MSGCPMNNGRGKMPEGQSPYRLVIESKFKVEATTRDYLQMMRPFYWPGQKDDPRHKVIVLRLLIILCITFLISGKVVNMLYPYFMGQSITYLAKKDRKMAIYNLILFCVFGFLGVLLQQLVNLSYHYVQCSGLKDLSLIIYKHLHTLSYQWFVDSRSGETIRSMTRGLESMRELTQFGLLTLVPCTLEAIAVTLVFFIYFKNYKLGVTLVVALFLYITTTIIITNWRQKTRQAQVQRDNEAHNISNDGLTNFETVKYYTNEKYEVERYTKAVLEHEICYWRVLKSLALINVTQDFLKQSCIVTCLVLTSLAVLDGDYDVGEVTSVLTYLYALYRPLFILGTVYSAILRAIAGIRDAANLLKTKPSVVDSPDAIELTIDSSDTNCETAMVEYENVSFKYNDEDETARWVLDNVSFKIPRGGSLAIVGSTGSGKTTVSRLLCRFLDVNKGSIKVGGKDITTVTQTSLRKNIGVVAQDTVLFHASLRENIRYAKWDATDDEIYNALKQASLYDRVMRFPQGLDTIVGERGLKLSGGEKQRVSIARCFLKDPPIIILDEATSSLDSKTESQIQDTLFNLFQDRTVITIAHRLSTIVHCDEIILLEQGNIVERGSHQKLLELGGPYSVLWATQLRGPQSSSSDTL